MARKSRRAGSGDSGSVSLDNGQCNCSPLSTLTLGHTISQHSQGLESESGAQQSAQDNLRMSKEECTFRYFEIRLPNPLILVCLGWHFLRRGDRLLGQFAFAFGVRLALIITGWFLFRLLL